MKASQAWAIGALMFAATAMPQNARGWFCFICLGIAFCCYMYEKPDKP